jgi:hypothetical protein
LACDRFRRSRTREAALGDVLKIGVEEQLPFAVQDLDLLGNPLDPSLGDLPLDRPLDPHPNPASPEASAPNASS